ncbi:unnamed protein product [Dibothriocephalus latus]|uniref:Uncharacterized protein n=1 Tax=Dibothriocephalus latus TaxID=60516 RepID=A0A3P7LA19_DIBLA|nr:unnamed protein product [Dibothriocephalus latus]
MRLLEGLENKFQGSAKPQTATTTQMLSSETRERTRQLIKQQQSASQGRLTHIPKKTRVTISPARKPLEQDESPHAVFFHPFPNVPSESEDVSELTEITASEPSLLSLSRTMCRAMSPSPPSETGVALVDEQSNHETEPICLKATASTFVVAKACSPRTSTADEKPVPQFQPPLTCSVSTPPGVEDVDKSTSEISYYTPQSNRTPSHFGVAKVASPNTRYAAQDNSTLEALGPSFHTTSPRIPQVVTQSATTLQDGLLPCDSPSNHRRNTMSSLTLDRHIQPICLTGEGRNLSVSHPNLRSTNVQPQPGLSEPLGRSLGNFLTAPPAISSHCPSPMTSPQIVTKARPQVTLAAPQLHVPNIHSPAINTTVSVPAAEMTKSSLITAQLDSIYRPCSPEFSQLPSVTQHSFEPDREQVSSAVPKAAGVDLQSAPSSLLISRVGSYPLSQLLSGQSTPPPPAAAGESYDCMHPLQSTSSRTSFSDVDAPTLKLHVDQRCALSFIGIIILPSFFYKDDKFTPTPGQQAFLFGGGLYMYFVVYGLFEGSPAGFRQIFVYYM